MRLARSRCGGVCRHGACTAQPAVQRLEVQEQSVEIRRLKAELERVRIGCPRDAVKSSQLQFARSAQTSG